MARSRKNEQELLAKSAGDLEAEIRHHNKLYWDDDKPEISDYDYDQLVRRLRELAPDSAVLEDMGPSAERTLGAEVVHARPMLSLDKCYSDEDLNAWAFQTRKGEVIGPRFEGEVMVTPKMDGIAASLRYDGQGRLSQVATRGSGAAGDDITVNARTIKDIPDRVSAGGAEVRGEIYMKLSVFSRFADRFSNPRNLAAGAIKHKDPLRCQAYELSFAAYDLQGAGLTTEEDKYTRLEAFGFPPMERELVAQDRLREGYESFAGKRDGLDFEIDGVVFKINQLAEQARLGETAHHPRFAIAYKFQGDQATTTLEAVEWSVARSGAITPVACVAPVTLSGAEVSRASLHHAGFLDKLGLLGKPAGAEVVVTRRGGVIPKVEFVVKHNRSSRAPKIGLVERCPSCGGPVMQQGDFLYCEEPGQCRDVIIGTIAHYCSVVDIQGFGDKLLAQCYDSELLRGPVDLYTLTVEKLVPLERVGTKLATNLVQQVDDHRTLELARFLRALGIEELGKHVSALLQEQYRTLARVRGVTADELAAIHTIGDIIADKVVGGLADQGELIDGFLAHVRVLDYEAPAAPAPGEAPLGGQSFVFTGKLESLVRKEAQQRVKALGGKAPAGVTKSLTHLVVGEGKGKKSSKQVKAEKIIADGGALAIITETEFLELVDGLGD